MGGHKSWEKRKIATGPPTLLSKNMCITRSLSPPPPLPLFRDIFPGQKEIERDLPLSARLSGREETDREGKLYHVSGNPRCIDHSSRPLVMTRNDAQYIIEFNYQLARSDPKFENSINRDRPRSVSFRRCSLLLGAHAAWHMEEVLQCSCWPPRRACRVFRHSQARESATSQPAQGNGKTGQ